MVLVFVLQGADRCAYGWAENSFCSGCSMTWAACPAAWSRPLVWQAQQQQQGQGWVHPSISKLQSLHKHMKEQAGRHVTGTTGMKKQPGTGGREVARHGRGKAAAREGEQEGGGPGGALPLSGSNARSPTRKVTNKAQ